MNEWQTSLTSHGFKMVVTTVIIGSGVFGCRDVELQDFEPNEVDQWSKVEFLSDRVPSSLIITYIYSSESTPLPAVSGVTADTCIPRPGKHSFSVIFTFYSVCECVRVYSDFGNTLQIPEFKFKHKHKVLIHNCTKTSIDKTRMFRECSQVQLKHFNAQAMCKQQTFYYFARFVKYVYHYSDNGILQTCTDKTVD